MRRKASDKKIKGGLVGFQEMVVDFSHDLKLSNLFSTGLISLLHFEDL
jgi:hypothetical protein